MLIAVCWHISITVSASFLTWFQGEVGQSKLSSPFDKAENAVKDFEKKFKDKTKNNWSDRMNFVSHPGKYTLIQVDGEQDAEIKVIWIPVWLDQGALSMVMKPQIVKITVWEAKSLKINK